MGPSASQVVSPVVSTVKKEEAASFDLDIEPEHDLAEHMSQYQKNMAKARSDAANVHQISEITDFFLSSKCKITKFNHCIDGSSKVTQYDGFMQLTGDDELKIMLKK